MTSDSSASFQFIDTSAIATPRTSRIRLKIINRPRPVKFLSCSMSDVEQLKNFTGRGLLMIFNLILLVLGVAIALVSMNWKLALLSLVILPLLYWRAAIFSPSIRPMFRASQDQVAKVATLVQDNAAGARVVKAFGQEQREIERFDEANAELYERYFVSSRVQSFNTPLLNFIANGATIVMLGGGGL